MASHSKRMRKWNNQEERGIKDKCFRTESSPSDKKGLITAEKTNEWVLEKAGVERELLAQYGGGNCHIVVLSCANDATVCRKR